MSIVVSGVGAVTPFGEDIGRIWAAFQSGESGIGPPPERIRGQDRGADRGIDRAGFVREMTRTPRGTGFLRRMDWCSRMLVRASENALRDAGLGPLDGDTSTRAAFVVGSGYGNQSETEAYLERILEEGLVAAPPLLFPNLALNAATGYASIALGLRGPNLALCEREASGEAALVAAVDLLETGQCDIVLAGGVDEFGNLQMRLLRERRGLAPGWERGTVLGEGASIVVLEREERARERGRVPYAVVRRATMSAVPSSPAGFPEPEVAAAQLLESLGDVAVPALLQSSDGTPRRDELDAALTRILGSRRRDLQTAVSRRSFGDWPAAGALAAALAAVALERQEWPGVGPAAIDAVLVPGFARGGGLAAILLGRASRV